MRVHQFIAAAVLFGLCGFALATPGRGQEPASARKIVRQHPPSSPKVALVIGNSEYEGGGRLGNPVRDAAAMENALQSLGFSVIKLTNVDLQGLEDGIVQFRRSLAPGGVGLVYYAGHGVQVGGENYLVPVGARLREEFEVRRQCYGLNDVLAAMEESQANLNVVVLDCCRDNPFARSWKRGGGDGLAAVSDTPEGTIIAFSTAPGQTAADGSGQNSPYTAQLVKALADRPQEGLKLREVFFRASLQVKLSTGQRPWLNLDASVEEYYLWRSDAEPMPAANSAQQPSAPPADTFTNSIGMKLTRIPAGNFMMGSPTSEADRYDNETQHAVKISQPFYLGVHEVTVGQFRRFVTETGYKTQGESDGAGGNGWDEATKNWKYDPKYTWRNPGFAQTDEHPVVLVSWNDANKFCEWLSRKEGRKYSLPTEAQWEYACRAGSTTAYSFGDDAEGLASVGNIADGTAKAKYAAWTWAIAAQDGYVHTAPVGQFNANAFGLYDLHGNVWEWCQDWYGDYPSGPVTDPRGPASDWRRVSRGGGWFNVPRDVRSADRGRDAPDYRFVSLGFRVAVQSR